MAEMVVRNMPLVMREMPFDIPPIREALQWNIANNNDRALRWVVERFTAAAAESEAETPGNVVPIEEAAEINRQSLEIEYRMNHPQR
jgi:LysR family nod box-dependent transcriptional activator